MQQENRYRKQMRFWLDLFKDNENELFEFLELLKSKKKYQPFMRKAIRITMELEAENLDALVEAYPWLPYVFRPAPGVNGGDAPIPIRVRDEQIDSSDEVIVTKDEASNADIISNFAAMMDDF